MWWLRFAFGVLAGLAFGWLLNWLVGVPWLRWTAVLLQLMGVATVVLGIVQTRYGLPLGVLLRSLLCSMGKREVTGTGVLEAQQGVVAGQGRLTPLTFHSLEGRVDALEKRMDLDKAGLEAAIRREGEQLRQRDAQLEVAPREQCAE